MKSVKPYLIAAAAGAAVYFAGQAYWNRRLRLESDRQEEYAGKGLIAQLWEAAPNLVRTATVGIGSGALAYLAAKKLG